MRWVVVFMGAALLAGCTAADMPGSRQPRHGNVPKPIKPPGSQKPTVGAGSPLEQVFTVSPSFETGMMGHFATGAALADINGDNLPDLIVANGNDMSPQPVVVFYNHYQGPGTQHFKSRPDWYSGDVDYHANLSVGDVNGDGRLDVAVAVPADQSGNPAGGGVKIYMNQGGALESEPSTRISQGFGAVGCALGDVTGDGRLDLVVPAFMTADNIAKAPVTFVPEEARIYVNNNGQINTTAAWTSTTKMVASNAIVADINQDGYMDVAFAAQSTAVFYGHEKTSIEVPLPTAANWLSTRFIPYSASIDVGFVGGGPKLALAVSAGCIAAGPSCTSNFLLFRPEQSTAPVWTSNPSQNSSHLLLADLNADNHLDLIAGQWGSSLADGASLWLFKGEGTGLPVAPSFETAESGMAVAEGLAVADLRRCAVSVKELKTKPDGAGVVITLPHRRIDSIVSVKVNGTPVERYAFAPEGNWVSISTPYQANDNVSVEYRMSPIADLVEATWSPHRGNLIYNSFLDVKLCSNNIVVK